MTTGYLTAVAVGGIAAIMILVMVFRLHAFISLLIVAMAVGLAAGMPPAAVLTSIQNGMGSSLGFIAVVVGVGTMFGAMLEISGGAQRLARSLISAFGENRAPWAMGITGLLVSIPIFLDVAFIILVPLVFTLARRAKRSTLIYAIPLLAGLAVSHTFIPPTPGPVAVAELLGADLGTVILYGLLAGIPTMIISGPIFGNWIGKRIHLDVPEWFEDETEQKSDAELPNFGLILSLILLPIALIVIGSFAGLAIKSYTAAGETAPAYLTWFNFLGHPFTALILATLLAFYTLGKLRGLTMENIQKIATKALGPAGMIILVTGAGGVFRTILIDSKIGNMLAEQMGGLGLSPLILAFLLASVVRIAQGSATVAMLTAAGFMAPMLEAFPTVDPAWMVISIAAGATIASHVNDTGFWLVKQFLGMDEKTTLKTWTVMETLVAVVGLVFVLIFSTFI